MIVDLKFFEHLVNTLQTEHNIITENHDHLKMTEAWMYVTGRLLNQCKEMIKVEKFIEEQDAIFSTMTDEGGLTMSDEEILVLMESNYQKYATKDETGE